MISAIAASGAPECGCSSSMTGAQLTSEEKEKVEELKERDREVRRHEEAHKVAAGQYARGGPTYEYTTGPDGRRYAVGGEVQIDTAKVPNNPEATIRKAQTIKRAALAPAEPSAKDRQVATEAERMEAEARAELAARRANDAKAGAAPRASVTYDRTGAKKEAQGVSAQLFGLA